MSTSAPMMNQILRNHVTRRHYGQCVRYISRVDIQPHLKKYPHPIRCQRYFSTENQAQSSAEDSDNDESEIHLTFSRNVSISDIETLRTRFMYLNDSGKISQLDNEWATLSSDFNIDKVKNRLEQKRIANNEPEPVKKKGYQPPEKLHLVFLVHGLLGSAINLLPLAKGIITDPDAKHPEKRLAIIVDQRNHGSSFTSPNCSLTQLRTDLAKIIRETVTAIGIIPETAYFDEDFNISDYSENVRISLLGHSLGGKTVMQVALAYLEREDFNIRLFSTMTYVKMEKHPEMEKFAFPCLNEIMVLDIAPKMYGSVFFRCMLEHLLSLEGKMKNECKNRGDVEKLLKNAVVDIDVKTVIKNGGEQFKEELWDENGVYQADGNDNESKRNEIIQEQIDRVKKIMSSNEPVDIGFRAFLLQNAIYMNTDSKKMELCPGLEHIRSNLHELTGWKDSSKNFHSYDKLELDQESDYKTQFYFIHGLNSEYLRPDLDCLELFRLFGMENITVHGVEGAGHWLHVSHFDETMKHVRGVLNKP